LYREGAALLAAGNEAAALRLWRQALDARAQAGAMAFVGLACDVARLAMRRRELSLAGDVLDAALAPARRASCEAGLIGQALALRGRLQGMLGFRAAAVETLREAAGVLEPLVVAGNAGLAVAFAHVLLDLGRARMAIGARADARATFADAADLADALMARDPGQAMRNLRSAVLNHLARAEEALGRMPVALALCQESVTAMRALVHGEGRADLAEDLARAEADLARLRSACLPSPRLDRQAADLADGIER
jgi:tetratricopeptide (TPR) repeat protein